MGVTVYAALATGHEWNWARSMWQMAFALPASQHTSHIHHTENWELSWCQIFSCREWLKLASRQLLFGLQWRYAHNSVTTFVVVVSSDLIRVVCVIKICFFMATSVTLELSFNRYSASEWSLKGVGNISMYVAKSELFVMMPRSHMSVNASNLASNPTVLTHLPLVPHICVSESVQHWLR